MTVETKRQLISGLAIKLTIIICLFGLWHLSPGITFVLSIGALLALEFFFWIAGKPS